MINEVLYQNPILTGFHADPSICRVGKDFYLAVSSFLYFPGIPVYHSRDLLNWEQIGNAVNFNNPVNYEGMKETGGIWAPTLRFHDGVFYLTAAVEGFGNFIIHAENPSGPWSEPVWIPVGGVDPDLYWEDGKLYYSTNERCGCTRESISMGVVDPFTGEIKEPFRPIWHGSGGPHLEAPHVYHIGGWYYLMAAEGGTAANHMITISRSRTIWGEYEACPKNPILSNRDDARHEIYGTGHGDLVEDENGNWWMVCLGTRTARRTMSHLGRETFLMPVHWEEEWPVCGTVQGDGEVRDISVHMKEQGPIPVAEKTESKSLKILEDTFKDSRWPHFWHFPGNPDMSQYERNQGRLIIRPQGKMAVILTPQADFNCCISADAEHKGADCGLILYHMKDFYYRFGLHRDSEGGYRISVQICIEDITSTLAELPWSQANVHLCILADKERYHFYYDKDKELTSFTTRYLSNEVVGRSFTGTMAGVYAEGKEDNSDAYAIVKQFKMAY